MLASLIYHRVDGERGYDPFYQVVSTKRLHEQLDVLAQIGDVLDPHALAIPSTLADLVRSPRLYILLTIDDGYADSVRAFHEACQQRGYRPLIFVSPAHFRDPEHYWWDCLVSARNSVHEMRSIQQELMCLPYREARRRVECPPSCEGHRLRRLSLSDLHQLGNSVSLGVHGYWHERIDSMSIELAESDLRVGWDTMSELPGYLPVFAYPYGIPPKSDAYIGLLRERFVAAFVADNRITSVLNQAENGWAMRLSRVYAVDQPGERLGLRLTASVSEIRVGSGTLAERQKVTPV